MDAKPIDGSAPLPELLKRARVIVAVGSGGVGKTTTSAAMAIAAARQGRRCAVLTIDPARRLAQALGIERMGNTPTALPAEFVGPGAVDAMMLETAEAFDDLIARLVTEPARRERLLANRLYQVIARHLGGTHEYMAVEKLYALSLDPRYDLVVLDTPPSVNALDFLDAPKRLASFFSERVTRFFVRRESEKKGVFQRLKDRAGELALSVLSKAFGDSFVEEVQDFATAFQGLFVAFRERGEMVGALLEDPATAFVVVSGADPVRVAEALEFSATLERLSILPRVFLVNRVHETRDETPQDFTAALLHEALGEKATAIDAGLVTEGLWRAQQLYGALERRDQAGLAELAHHVGRERIVVVPELEAEVGDRSAVEHVLCALGAPQAPQGGGGER